MLTEKLRLALEPALQRHRSRGRKAHQFSQNPALRLLHWLRGGRLSRLQSTTGVVKQLRQQLRQDPQIQPLLGRRQRRQRWCKRVLLLRSVRWLERWVRRFSALDLIAKIKREQKEHKAATGAPISTPSTDPEERRLEEADQKKEENVSDFAKMLLRLERMVRRNPLGQRRHREQRRVRKYIREKRKTPPYSTVGRWSASLTTRLTLHHQRRWRRIQRRSRFKGRRRRGQRHRMAPNADAALQRIRQYLVQATERLVAQPTRRRFHQLGRRVRQWRQLLQQERRQRLLLHPLLRLPEERDSSEVLEKHLEKRLQREHKKHLEQRKKVRYEHNTVGLGHYPFFNQIPQRSTAELRARWGSYLAPAEGEGGYQRLPIFSATVKKGLFQ